MSKIDFFFSSSSFDCRGPQRQAVHYIRKHVFNYRASACYSQRPCAPTCWAETQTRAVLALTPPLGSMGNSSFLIKSFLPMYIAFLYIMMKNRFSQLDLICVSRTRFKYIFNLESVAFHFYENKCIKSWALKRINLTWNQIIFLILQLQRRITCHQVIQVYDTWRCLLNNAASVSASNFYSVSSKVSHWQLLLLETSRSSPNTRLVNDMFNGLPGHTHTHKHTALHFLCEDVHCYPTPYPNPIPLTPEPLNFGI